MIPSKKRQAELLENPYNSLGPDELAFSIAQLVLHYLPTEPEFADYYTAIGILESVKLELFRQGLSTFTDQHEDMLGGIGFEELPQNRGR